MHQYVKSRASEDRIVAVVVSQRITKQRKPDPNVWIEYAVFAVVYFLTEVPPLLGVVAVYRCYRACGCAAHGPVSEPPVTQ